MVKTTLLQHESLKHTSLLIFQLEAVLFRYDAVNLLASHLPDRHQHMILFIDFDGVLHPASPATVDYFCHVHRLDSLLQELPDVRIVISSSWRHTRALQAVIDSFPDDLRSRIIGMTPAVPHIFNPQLRYDEILAWIKQNQYVGPWIALDDARHEFPPDLPQLVHCEPNVGLDEAAIERLKEVLNALA